MDSQHEIWKIRKQIENDQLRLKQLEEQQGFNPMGKWEFSTEGDAEGKTTNKLGIYVGNIFDGIKKYSGMEYYKLSIRKMEEVSELSSEQRQGKVDVVIYDKFIQMHDKEDTENKLSKYLPDGFSIEKSNNYGAVKISWKN